MSHLNVEIDRVSKLTEEDGRMQIYTLLEILHASKYRPKLPTNAEIEVQANILQAKRIAQENDLSASWKNSPLGVAEVESLVQRMYSIP